MTNFRGFEHASIDLHPEVTLFVGVNGAGKTTCLDAITIPLSSIARRISLSKAGLKTFSEKDVLHKGKQVKVVIQTNREFGWTRIKPPVLPLKSNLTGIAYLNKLKERIKENEQISIPLFVFYPVGRTVLDIPIRIRKKHEFDLLEAYDGALSSGVNFRSFFEWFRNREDLENETKIAQLEQAASRKVKLKADKQLEAVRRAISIFMPSFTELKVRRNPLRMTITKLGKTLEIQQLSDGEKCTLALVGDLARRLAIANPIPENPLEGEGIVLIDEIELHLHPKWQRELIGNLRRVFPNCQFILSTHSPQAIGELPHECIRLLYRNDDGTISWKTPDQSLGLTTNEILEEIMEAGILEEEVAQMTSDLYDLIDKEKWTVAEKLLNDLKAKVNGWTPELRKAEALMGIMRADSHD